jgi:hypothetical protein
VTIRLLRLAGSCWVFVAAAVPGWGAADDFEHMRNGFPLTGAHERIACEDCHVYTDSTLTTIKESRSGEHRVNRGDW